MALKSRIPGDASSNFDPATFRYLEGLDRRIPARADLSGSATTADAVTALNSLFADLRDAGIMERN